MFCAMTVEKKESDTRVTRTEESIEVADRIVSEGEARLGGVEA